MNLFAVLLAAIGLAAGGHPREFVVTSARDGDSELYLVREDGSGLGRLTANRASDYGAVWSPDGRRLAFVSDRDGDEELYVLDVLTRSARGLTRNAVARVVAGRPPDRVLKQPRRPLHSGDLRRRGGRRQARPPDSHCRQ